MRFPKTVAVVRTYKVKRSGALQVLSMATDWSPPLVAQVYQPGFAWCHRHGANRMALLSQKVVTSGIACNTISRKWGPTSVSQPPKPFDGSTSASASLRSVELSTNFHRKNQSNNQTNILYCHSNVLSLRITTINLLLWQN